MRIGFDAKRAFCNFRGLGNYSRNTFAALTENFPDNDYFLFTPETKKEYESLAFPQAKKITPAHAFGNAVWRSWGCTRDIKKLHLDLYHGLSHELPIGIAHTKVKSVVTIHDLIFLTHPHLYPWIDRQLYQKKYFRSAETADKIIAISHQTKLDLMEWWKIPEEKIEVVYQGCSPQFMLPCSEEKSQQIHERYQLPSQYLLHVGTIERRKNQEVIIKALKYGKLDIPLVLAGRHTDYVKSLWDIDPEFVKKRVIFLPNFADEDLPALYQNASLFIYPSLYEGFGIPILEALASGTPVITSEGRCLREAGGEGALYLPAESHDALAANIRNVLSDNNLRNDLIQRGKQQIQKFTPKAIAQNLIKVYQDVIL